LIGAKTNGHRQHREIGAAVAGDDFGDESDIGHDLVLEFPDVDCGRVRQGVPGHVQDASGQEFWG